VSYADKHISFYESPSFTDYDVVIIDPERIYTKWWFNKNVVKYDNGTIWSYSNENSGFSSSLMEFMRRRAEEVSLLLEKTGGIVVCFLRDKHTPLYCASNIHEPKTGKYSVIHTYSWIPEIEIRKYLEKCNGKEITEIDKKHPFSQYFSALKDEIYFEVVMDDSNLPEFSKPIARNKVGEVIAFEIPFGKGKFIFLPLFHSTKEDIPEKVAGVLIDCIRKSLN
jgi:hypothetical protein